MTFITADYADQADQEQINLLNLRNQRHLRLTGQLFWAADNDQIRDRIVRIPASRDSYRDFFFHQIPVP